MDDYLLLSGIQHFCFCRRQWALIHIENQWAENQLTAEGRLMHERTHDNSLVTSRNGIITVRGVSIKSEQFHITGHCDVLELIPDDNGISLAGRKGKWRIHPVEYKRGHIKSNDCDRLQLAAECLCLEEMLSCRIKEGSLFYGETRHRETVEITQTMRSELESILMEMWDYYRRGYTPKVRRTKACHNCSLANLCLPELEKTENVSAYVARHINEELP